MEKHKLVNKKKTDLKIVKREREGERKPLPKVTHEDKGIIEEMS